MKQRTRTETGTVTNVSYTAHTTQLYLQQGPAHENKVAIVHYHDTIPSTELKDEKITFYSQVDNKGYGKQFLIFEGRKAETGTQRVYMTPVTPSLTDHVESDEEVNGTLTDKLK